MRLERILAAATAQTLALALAGCAGGDAGHVQLGQVIYFNGMVYDGATGGRVTSYRIDLEYLDRFEVGRVAPNGLFTLGPLSPMHDYTVSIQADGYRSFFSHNPFYDKGGKTYFYDAYLFPTDVQAPDALFHVTLSDSEEKPSGLVRLRPSSPSLLYDEASERPAGIDGQLWDNDDDLQFGSVTAPFSDGVAQITGDRLVYGVSYAVTVFGVPGYQPLTSGFQAGIDGEQGLVLSPVVRTPLAVAYRSDTAGANQKGTLTIVLNLPVELDPPSNAAKFTEAVDAQLVVQPVDGDNDGVMNQLADDKSPDAIERGTKITVQDNQIVLEWNPSLALASSDPDDPVTVVTYGGLDQVRVRPAKSDASQAVTLASLLGSPFVSISLVP